MTISSLKKHLSLNRAVLLLGLLFLLCNANAQSYYNRIYDYQGENPEGASGGNILFHDGHTYTAGARDIPIGVEVVLSKWDLNGNLIQESTMDVETDSFFPLDGNHFDLHNDQYYYVATGANNDALGIYCFDLNMDSLWTTSYDLLDGFEIAYMRKMTIFENHLYIGAVHRPDDESGQWYGVAEFDELGEFVGFAKTIMDSDQARQHAISSLSVSSSEIFVSGHNLEIEGIPTREGYISKTDRPNGLVVEEMEQGHPNHIDSPIFIEDLDENYLLGVQLITDSIYTGGLLPNENYWFNHLSTFLVDKETLEVSEMEDHQHFFQGYLYHMEPHESGYGLLGNQNTELGTYVDAWVTKFTPELEQEYHFSLNFLPCSTGCRHILYDLAFDDWGNGYAIGRVDLDTLDYDSRYSWMVAFDCHGRTEEPEFNSGIDSMLTQSGNYFLQPTSELMDNYYWTFNNQEIYSENVLLEMEEGQNNITLHSTYCGREFEENMVIDVPININEVQNNPVLIYPNPVQDQLFLKGMVGSIEQLEIYSTDGKLLLSQELFNTGSALDVSALPSGNYVLTYQQGIEHFAIQFSKVE